MRTSFFSSLLLIAVFGLLGLSTASAQITLSIDPISGLVGGNVTVDVNITGADATNKLMIFNFKVNSSDPNVSLVSVDVPGTLSENLSNDPNNNDLPTVSGSSFTEASGVITSDGVLVKLVFSLSGPVVGGTISLSNVEFYNSAFALLTVSPDPVTTSATATDPGSNTAPSAGDTTLGVVEDNSGTVNVTGFVTDSEEASTVLTYSVQTNSTNGATVSNGDGTFTYTPNADFAGSDSFVYLVTDVGGLTDTGTVTVTVTGENDAPVAGTGGGESLDEDAGPLSIDVTAYVTDVDTDPGNLSYSADAVSTAGGTITETSEGIFSYSPVANYFGTDTFTYTVTDDGALSDSETITITVSAVNDAPTVTDLNGGTMLEDGGTLTINVTPGATDIDSSTLTFSVVSPTAGGNTVAAIGGGNVLFVPDDDYSGTDTFTYIVTDDGGLSANATVTVTVTAVNDAPVATNDAAATTEDTPVTVNFGSNDTDPENDTLTWLSASTSAQGGTITDNGDGTASYSPAANFSGTDTFTYTVSDPSSASDTGTVTVTVTEVNDAPVLADVAGGSIDEDATTALTIDVTGSVTDIDSATFTFSGDATSANGGSVTDNGDGTFAYLPAADFAGTDTFTVTVSDGEGGTDTGTVTVTVNPINDAPVAADVSGGAVAENGGPLTIDVTGSVSDVETAVANLIYTADATSTNGGTVVNNGDGTYAYTPAANFDGTDTFTYRVEDAGGLSDSGTVTVSVTDVNLAPVATDDTASTNEDTSVSVNFGSNDSDPEGDTMTFVAASTSTEGGTVTDNGNGTATYAPPSNFNGTDTFTYTVSDPSGASDTGTVTITVSAVNDAPVAAALDAGTTNEDTALTGVDVTGSVTDVDDSGAALTYTADAASANAGTVTNNGDGTFDYAPALNFSGTDSFSYTVTDAGGLTSTETVSITVTAVNDAPVGPDITGLFVEKNDVLSVDLSTSVSDVDDSTGSLTITTDAASAQGGSVVAAGSGVFVYAPQTDFVGTDSFGYTVTDGGGLTDTGTVTITVTETNTAPTATDVALTTNEDTAGTVDLGAGVTDAEQAASTMSYSVTSGPSSGSVSDNGDGTFTYTPNANFNGADTFDFTVTDNGGLSSSASASITVDPVNDLPVADDATASPSEDTAAVIALSATDVDEDTVTYTVTSGPSSGSVSIIDPIYLTGGQSTAAATYTPNTNFNGSDSFTYVVSDGSGNSNTATVTITVTAVNDNPTAPDTDVTTLEDSAVTVDVTGLVSDVEDTLEDLSFAVASAAGNGTATSTGNGTFSYLPNSGYSGSDVFTYQVTDSDGGTDTGTVFVTVTPANASPVAADDTASTDEDVSASGDASANDSDADGDALSFVIATQPSDGLAVMTTSGSFTYAPEANFNGTDSFTYTVSDGNGGSDTGTVTITVAPVNDAPVAAPLSASSGTDTPVSLTASATDVDSDSFTFSIVGFPSNGLATISGSTITYTPNAGFKGEDVFTYKANDGELDSEPATVSVSVSGVKVTLPTVSAGPTGTSETLAITTEDLTGLDVTALELVFTYDPSVISVDGVFSIGTITSGMLLVPNVNTPGIVRIAGAGTSELSGSGTLLNFDVTYLAEGTTALEWDTVIFNTGNPIAVGIDGSITAIDNLPPSADDASATTAEDTQVTIPLTATDPEGDDIEFRIGDSPLFGEATIEGSNALYTPEANYNGEDSFTVQAFDGSALSDPATVSVTITPVNDAPDADDKTATTPEDTAVGIIFSATDPEGDTISGYAVAEQPAHGSVQVTSNVAIYTPADSFSGTDTFTYTATDGTATSDPATVTITVTGVNDPPSAVDDAYSVDEEGTLTVAAAEGVTANDTDPEGDDLSAVLTGDVSSGELEFESDGSFTYSPATNFVGSDTFTYVVTDGEFVSAAATVTITVNPVNDLPTAFDTSSSGAEDTDQTISLSALDLDEDEVAYSIVAGPSNGSVSIIDPIYLTGGISTADATYTPNADFNGSDSFTFKVTDAEGDSNTATVTITVDPVNDAPVASDLSAETDESVAVGIELAGTDVEEDDLTFALASEPAHGSVTLLAGVAFYDPESGYFGEDTFTYVANDGTLDSEPATVTVTVNAVNDAPETAADSYGTAEDVALTVDAAEGVLANDTDPDGDPLVVELADDVANGSLMLNTDGSFEYVSDADYFGDDSFTYTVFDGLVTTAPETVTISVSPVNDAPVAQDIATFVDEDGVVVIPLVATDVDSGTILYDVVADPAFGTASLSGSNVIYAPTPDFNGSDTFTYIATDGQAISEPAFVEITVLPTGEAFVQVAHNAPDPLLDPIDVYVDGILQLNNVFYQEGSPFLTLPDGLHEVSVVPSGQPLSNAVLTAQALLGEDQSYTVIAAGTVIDGLDAHVFEGTKMQSGSDTAVEILVYHGAPGTSAVDVEVIDETFAFPQPVVATLASNLAYGESSGTYLGTSPRAFNVRVSSAGSTIEEFRVPLVGFAGRAIILMVSGEVGEPAPYGFSLWGLDGFGSQVYAGLSTAIGESDEVPDSFELRGNYPNPFNPATNVQFDLPEAASVTLTLHDMLGRQVLTTPAQQMSAGSSRTIMVDASSLSSGVYIYRVVAQSPSGLHQAAGTMTLLK